MTETLIQSGALGVLALAIVMAGRFLLPLVKEFLEGMVEEIRRLNDRTEKQTRALDQIVTRLDQHEDLLKDRRCIYRDQHGNPVEGSGFPRPHAPSVPDGA